MSNENGAHETASTADPDATAATSSDIETAILWTAYKQQRPVVETARRFEQATWSALREEPPGTTWWARQRDLYNLAYEAYASALTRLHALYDTWYEAQHGAKPDPEWF